MILNNNGNGRGPYKTINKQLIEAGFDPKNMTSEDWIKFASLKPNGTNGHRLTHNSNQVIEDDEVKADTFSSEDVKKIIAKSEEREQLKKGDYQADEDEEPEYIDFKTEEEKEAEKKTADRTEYDEAEAEFRARWEGIDGDVIILGLDALGMMVVPKICDRFNRERPDETGIALSPKAKMILKPAADALMLKLARKIKTPAGLIAGVILFHWIGVAMKQPKLQHESDNTEPE